MSDPYRHQSLPIESPAAAFPRDGAGPAALAQAFQRALVSLWHPRMLLALLLPFIIMAVGAVLLVWFAWTPVSQWLMQQQSSWSALENADAWLTGIGLFSLKVWLTPLLAALLLLPLAGLLGLLIAAVFITPMVMSHLEKTRYPGLQRKGRHGWALSLWNACWVGTVFCAGWVVTLPLWLLPPAGMVLSIFWWTFAFTRLMRVDVLAEHASPDERRLLLQRQGKGFWYAGLICALLNLLPPAWLVLPVYSALVFGHYGMEGLSRLRTGSVHGQGGVRSL